MPWFTMSACSEQVFPRSFFMNKFLFRLFMCLVCALAFSACKKSSSPTTPTPTTVTVSAVEQVSPAANLSIPNSSQPVKLTIKNATVGGGGGAATYEFEVATDAAFANKVITKSGVVEGSGQTTVTLDTLAAGDYFWRARATVGSTP